MEYIFTHTYREKSNWNNRCIILKYIDIIYKYKLKKKIKQWNKLLNGKSFLTAEAFKVIGIILKKTEIIA